MAGPTQYGFDMREAAIAFIKAQDIHEGKWWTAIELNLGSGLFGPNADEAQPGGIVTIKRFLLTQADNMTPERFVVDAAKVNPKSSHPPTRPPSTKLKK
jgi:hypothetical protein